eukprot:GHVS01086561.1.p1 GENE.GHVS01086561.1~~GHVS01086561.1.p1  ORF type:complete len:410 (+),score=70.02 GHVS01086561.1:35-1264(+)
MASPEWCLIESDPGVFSELVDTLGVEGVEFEEVYSIDDIQQVPSYLRNDPTDIFRSTRSDEWKRKDVAELESTGKSTNGQGSQSPNKTASSCRAERKIFGLVFLFKWKGGKTAGTSPPLDCPEEPALFFAKQVIPNACATQAILSILFNSVPRLQLSQPLRELQDFSAEFDASMKGLAISNSDILRQTHNSFKAPASFATDDSDDASDDASFHFVSYICFEGARCYEIDGLQLSPKFLGEVSKGEAPWTEVAVPTIRDRINRLQEGREGSEIRFNLLACVEKSLDVLKKEILRCRHLRQRSIVKLLSFGDCALQIDSELDDSLAPDTCPTLEELPGDEATLKQAVEAATMQIGVLRDAELADVTKRQKWAKENQRRRHALAPFVLCALRHMARRGELRTSLDAAVAKAT